MITMRSFFAIALFATAASATELTVPEWLTPPRSDTKYYPDKDASVGDTITFSWPGMSLAVHFQVTRTI